MQNKIQGGVLWSLGIFRYCFWQMLFCSQVWSNFLPLSWEAFIATLLCIDKVFLTVLFIISEIMIFPCPFQVRRAINFPRCCLVSQNVRSVSEERRIRTTKRPLFFFSPSTHNCLSSRVSDVPGKEGKKLRSQSHSEKFVKVCKCFSFILSLSLSLF